MHNDSLSVQGALSEWITETFSKLFFIHSFKEALTTSYFYAKHADDLLKQSQTS